MKCALIPIRGWESVYFMLYGDSSLNADVSHYKVNRLISYDSVNESGHDCIHTTTTVSGSLPPEDVVNIRSYNDDDGNNGTSFRSYVVNFFNDPSHTFRTTGYVPSSRNKFYPAQRKYVHWIFGNPSGYYVAQKGQFGWTGAASLWMWDVNWSTGMASRMSFDFTTSETYETPDEAFAAIPETKWVPMYPWRVTIGDTPRPNVSKILLDVAGARNSALFSECEDNWDSISRQLTPYGTMCSNAADNTSFNHTNAIALVHDVLTLPREIKSFPKMIDALFSSKSLKDAAKNISNIFLSGKYGARLTWSDLGDIADNILGNIPPKSKTSFYQDEEAAILGRIFSGQQWISFDWQYRVFSNLIMQLDRRNLIPHLNDLWDLVPYSFVVDWILPIGEYLDYVDTKLRLDHLDVSNIWLSTKLKTTYVVENGLLLYNVDQTVYRRQGMPLLISAPPGSSSPTLHDHVVEATALGIQRLR